MIGDAMAWHDDSWKDGYDTWKLASPDDYRDECLHEDYEADINGRAHCCSCPHSWWLTAEEIEAERERYESYDREMRKAEWRLWLKDQINRLAFWRRWRKPTPIDDDVPF